MKILITGGAGFIGSHLAERLMDKHEVCIIDNLATGRRDNVPDHKNVKFIEGSIGCTAFTSAVFQSFKPDMVVHAAASYKNPNAFHEDAITNVVGTINIINMCKQHEVKKIVYFQTSLCYGLKPIEQPITLNHPLYGGGYSGGSSYAISKTTAEQYIALSGIPFISFRLANAYGARNLSGALPTFYHRLTNNLPIVVANTRRDFIYIQDLIDVVVKGLFSEKTGYYHVSTGGDFSVQHLFELCLKVLGMERPDNVEYKERGEDDVASILIDPTKTNKDFNWEAQADLLYGINQAFKWYRNNPITETFTHLKIGKK